MCLVLLTFQELIWGVSQCSELIIFWIPCM